MGIVVRRWLKKSDTRLALMDASHHLWLSALLCTTRQKPADQLHVSVAGTLGSRGDCNT